jgi:hypothetical protein
MKNEQEKKKSYISPAMEVVEFDCGSPLLQPSKENNQNTLNIVID